MVDHRADSRPVGLQVKGSFLGIERLGAENCVERVAEDDRRVQVTRLLERQRGRDTLVELSAIEYPSAPQASQIVTA
jgi:hypothetical protein